MTLLEPRGSRWPGQLSPGPLPRPRILGPVLPDQEDVAERVLQRKVWEWAQSEQRCLQSLSGTARKREGVLAFHRWLPDPRSRLFTPGEFHPTPTHPTCPPTAAQ